MDEVGANFVFLFIKINFCAVKMSNLHSRMPTINFCATDFGKEMSFTWRCKTMLLHNVSMNFDTVRSVFYVIFCQTF